VKSQANNRFERVAEKCAPQVERYKQKKEGHMENPNIKILTTSHGPVEYLDTGNGEVVLSLHGAMGGYDSRLLSFCFCVIPSKKKGAVGKIPTAPSERIAVKRLFS
jgi:hypothetical protein